MFGEFPNHGKVYLMNTFGYLRYGKKTSQLWTISSNYQ